MSEVKNSVISSSQQAGVWHNANGVVLPDGQKGFYKWTYVMQDGTTITANHKENKPLTGPCSYEIRISNEYGNLGKVSKPQEEQYTGTQTTKSNLNHQSSDDKNRSFALSYAKDIACSRIENNQNIQGVTSILKDANEMLEWLENKPAEVKQPPVQGNQGALPPQPQQPDAFQQTDDLPF